MDNQEAKNDSNILVIGNGFDLAHNLPTSYKDFIRAIERNIQAPNFSDTESHLEKVPLDICAKFRVPVCRRYYRKRFGEKCCEVDRIGI